MCSTACKYWKHCHTCFANHSRVLAHARLLAQATEIFAVDAEHVFVAHDQIRNCAVCSSIVLINSKPFLEREKK